MGKTHKIYNWEEWKDICDQYNIDPFNNADFGIDQGLGNSIDFEYKGDYPGKKDSNST